MTGRYDYVTNAQLWATKLEALIEDTTLPIEVRIQAVCELSMTMLDKYNNTYCMRKIDDIVRLEQGWWVDRTTGKYGNRYKDI